MNKITFKLKSLLINESSKKRDKLIQELTKEHQHLIELYNKIKQETNPKKKLKLLKDFYYEYNLHMLKEEKQLYNYLYIKYRFIPDKQEYIQQKHKDIKDITNFIEEFAKKYSKVESIQTEEFEKEFETLGKILTQRIKTEEEKLFSLY